MISHGLVSAALFLCVGVIYERKHTRDIRFFGGLVNNMPKYAIVFMIFTLGAVGLPGTTGFVGEFLILIGAFKKSFIVAALASIGVILSAAYMLWLYRRVIFGKIVNEKLHDIIDLSKVEILILWLLAFPVIFYGFYPEPLFKTVDISVTSFIENYDLKINYILAEKN